MPIATTFEYNRVPVNFGYCYPNKQWFIQKPDTYLEKVIIPARTEEMGGFRFVPTTPHQTNEKLKTYLKNEWVDKEMLPKRMRLWRTQTYGIYINHPECLQYTNTDQYNSYQCLGQFPHTPNRPFYPRKRYGPKYEAPCGNITIMPETRVGYHSVRDTCVRDTRAFTYHDSLPNVRYPERILRSVYLSAYIIGNQNWRFLKYPQPVIFMWFLKLRYDAENKQIVWNEDGCYKACLAPEHYHIEKATPYGSRDMDIDAVHGGSPHNADRVIDFLLHRFFG